MTFDTIVTRVTTRMRRTAAADITRIGQFVNDRYKEVVTGVGLEGSVRSDITAVAVIGSRLLTFTAEKLFAVWDPSVSPARILVERTPEEMRNMLLGTDPPRYYSVENMYASTVIIKADSVAASTYTLGASAQITLVDLAGATVPNFSTAFHDVLYRGAMADEYEFQEKMPLADRQESKFEKRLSELRYYIAKSAYLALYAGKMAPEEFR